MTSKVGFVMRWRQGRRKGETTGQRVYTSLDDLIALCKLRNDMWISEDIQYWPTEYSEAETIPELVTVVQRAGEVQDQAALNKPRCERRLGSLLSA